MFCLYCDREIYDRADDGKKTTGARKRFCNRRCSNNFHKYSERNWKRAVEIIYRVRFLFNQEYQKLGTVDYHPELVNLWSDVEEYLKYGVLPKYRRQRNAKL